MALERVVQGSTDYMVTKFTNLAAQHQFYTRYAGQHAEQGLAFLSQEHINAHHNYGIDFDWYTVAQTHLMTLPRKTQLLKRVLTHAGERGFTVSQQTHCLTSRNEGGAT